MGPVGERSGLMRRLDRRARRILGAAVAAVLVVGSVVGVWLSIGGGHRVAQSECRVAVGGSRYLLDVQQAANATTITAVGKRLGMPDHAVTIALATALQESRLHNVSYGDRDSLGLFQQRPSQGWGTPAELMRPQYAAAAFFKALSRVPGWQAKSVTGAAQAVQRSDTPQAYADWEPLARTLAIATTGEAPAALTCELAHVRANGASTSPVATLRSELGLPALGQPVSPSRGWTVAAWLVGHAEPYGITSIRFAGREWTPSGAWTAVASTGPGVEITQTPRLA